jgi:hypothetical protein
MWEAALKLMPMRIEGAKLSDTEIEKLLSKTLLVIDVESLHSRDQQEIAENR